MTSDSTSRLAISLARQRWGVPFPTAWGWRLAQNYWMPPGHAERMGADAVLSFERYPINATLPVIWIGGTADVTGMRQRRVAEREIEGIVRFKQEANARAAVTVIPTHSKKRMFDEAVRPTRPTMVIPLFQPIEAATQEQFLEKWRDPTPLKLLFLGRAPRAKGLALVLDAYRALQELYPKKVSLHVVTTFQDGPVEVPQIPGLVLDSLIPHSRAIELMTEAHYLLMPSVREEYGFVYIEAMARGAIPLASDSPVQRDLLDEGRAGLLAERSAESIVEAIRPGIENPESAKSLAAQAFALWRNRYAPTVVAQQYADLADRVLQQSRARR